MNLDASAWGEDLTLEEVSTALYCKIYTQADFLFPSFTILIPSPWIIPPAILLFFYSSYMKFVLFKK